MLQNCALSKVQLLHICYQIFGVTENYLESSFLKAGSQKTEVRRRKFVQIFIICYKKDLLTNCLYPDIIH